MPIRKPLTEGNTRNAQKSNIQPNVRPTAPPPAPTSSISEYFDKGRMTSTEYCKNNGSICPYCRSIDIDAVDAFETQDSVTYQLIKCNSCGKCWTDIRGLVSYEEHDESKLL